MPPSYLITGAPPPPVPQARERPRPPARAQRSSKLHRYRLKQLQSTVDYDASVGTVHSVSAVEGAAFDAFEATVVQELSPQEDPLS